MCFGAAISSQAAHAANDPNAAVVKLRTSCLENNYTLNNCFTTTSALQNWINASPSTVGPISVEIGPGTLKNGSYTLTPSKTGCTFTPASRSATINNSNVSGWSRTGFAGSGVSCN